MVKLATSEHCLSRFKIKTLQSHLHISTIKAKTGSIYDHQSIHPSLVSISGIVVFMRAPSEPSWHECTHNRALMITTLSLCELKCQVSHYALKSTLKNDNLAKSYHSLLAQWRVEGVRIRRRQITTFKHFKSPCQMVRLLSMLPRKVQQDPEVVERANVGMLLLYLTYPSQASTNRVVK